MPVYVDDLVRNVSTEPRARRVGARHGHLWCHLWADSRVELLAFARRIGMRAAWIQTSRRGLWHFDLVPPRREVAIRAGAIALDRAAAVECMRRVLAARPMPHGEIGTGMREEDLAS